MPRYRSKVHFVEAMQWFPGRNVPGVHESEIFEAHFFVVTSHEQRVFLEAGDWVLPEPDGVHFYPVKDVIFRRRYELDEGDLS